MLYYGSVYKRCIIEAKTCVALGCDIRDIMEVTEDMRSGKERLWQNKC